MYVGLKMLKKFATATPKTLGKDAQQAITAYKRFTAKDKIMAL